MDNDAITLLVVESSSSSSSSSGGGGGGDGGEDGCQFMIQFDYEEIPYSTNWEKAILPIM